MTMNLKKVFTSTSFNLSSVFYARFCAGSFYQEFDECRTFLLYKKKKPLTRYLLTHQQLLSCFVSVYYSVLFRLFTIFNTVVIIHIHAEFYRGIWFSVAQEAHSFHMNRIFFVFCFIYFLIIYYDSFIIFCLYIKEILLLLMILFNLKYYIITYISWARRGHCPQKYK